ncbi:MAG: hypothetical protein DHS20C11_01040 [Lysobacteraceae bacterium]|nr:MAG: hypothetical protein DHS20C11_01040 [Xanthomonadaceae bacterium]
MPLGAHAFEQDSHYYLRFGLSLAACFNWDEAHLIASGDWGMDENGSTHAEMNPVQTTNKTQFHAFGHSDARFRELWLRSLDEQDPQLRLVKLGQFMHFLEDWESHAGYGIRMGHARDTFAGRDPDSLGNNLAKNYRMVQSALDHLLATCEDLGRTENRDRVLVELMLALVEDGLIEDLYENSEADWKKGKLGGFRPDGPEIKNTNKARIEQMIAERVSGRDDKGVPGHFQPGSEDRGIPPSLAIPFNEKGEVITRTRVAQAMNRWANSSDPAPDVVLSLDDARGYYRRSGTTQKGGWRVKITASNSGELPSPAGNVDVLVVDSDQEVVLAEATTPLPVLSPGDNTLLTIDVPYSGPPEPDVIVGTFARVGGFSAMNDEDWLMLGDAEYDDPDVPITTDLDPPVTDGDYDVNLVADPEFHFIGDMACLVVQVMVEGGDSTEHLDQAMYELVAGEDRLVPYADVESYWSAFSTPANLVAGKAISCYRPGEDTRQLLDGKALDQVSVSLHIEVDGEAPTVLEQPISPEAAQRLFSMAQED